MYRIDVQTAPIDVAAEQEDLRSAGAQIGALVTFVGQMRDIDEGLKVGSMTLEHYPGMTEKALGTIAAEAAQRWAVERIRIVHRVGPLAPQDVIVLVGVASRHRGDAFRACEFLIDYLKTRAPFWKKEATAEGERWVDARESDNTAALKWRSEPGC